MERKKYETEEDFSETKEEEQNMVGNCKILPQVKKTDEIKEEKEREGKGFQASYKECNADFLFFFLLDMIKTQRRICIP